MVKNTLFKIYINYNFSISEFFKTYIFSSLIILIFSLRNSSSDSGFGKVASGGGIALVGGGPGSRWAGARGMGGGYAGATTGGGPEISHS